MIAPSVSEEGYDCVSAGRVFSTADPLQTTAICSLRVLMGRQLARFAGQQGGRLVRWRVVPFRPRRSASALLQRPARVTASLLQSSPTCLS